MTTLSDQTAATADITSGSASENTGATARPAPGQWRTLNLALLSEGYTFSARAEGKSQRTIEAVTASVRYLEEYLVGKGLPCELAAVTLDAMRGFVLFLQDKPRFVRHPYTPRQPGKLSAFSVSSYLRSLQAFFTWAEKEGLSVHNPFHSMKLPKTPYLIKPALTDEQVASILSAVDLKDPNGRRDYLAILILFDCGPRAAGLTGLKLHDIDMENQLFTFTEKGNRQRQVPYGVKVQKALWQYVKLYRPEPALPSIQNLLLTRSGRPITKDRLRGIVKKYCRKAGLDPTGISPHSFRRTAALKMFRAGANLFLIQSMLGHRQLSTTRGYIAMDKTDLQRMHRACSPADNLGLDCRTVKVSCSSEPTTSLTTRHLPQRNGSFLTLS
jgi:site-specific recombinase XerD